MIAIIAAHEFNPSICIKRSPHTISWIDLGMEIKYWVLAYDGRTPEPGMGKRRELTALVVSDDEKRRDLQNRATDSITGINETAARQEKLNVQLGEIIRARAVSSPNQNE